MTKKIMQITGFIVVTFVLVALVLLVLNIWGAMSGDVMREGFIKLTYTLGVILIASILVAVIVEMVKDDEDGGDKKYKPLSFHKK